MANTYKIRRGMIFWYNLDERIDKNSRPTILIDGKEYPDHRQYGMRHWLVVSNDDGNVSAPTCTVVPITGANSKANIPAHATVSFRERNFEVLCEQIMTVNIVSLKEYAYTLSEHDMHKVDQALAVQCSLVLASNSSEIEQRLLQLEQRMEALLSQYETAIKNIITGYEKSLEELKNTSSNNQIPACKIPIEKNYTENGKTSSNKESKCPAHPAIAGKTGNSDPRVPVNKHLSQIEKFNTRYPNVAPAASPVPTTTTVPAPSKKQTKKHKWTQEMMQEYLNDTATLPPMRIAEKWGLKDIRTIYSMKYYIQSRLKDSVKVN